MTTGYLTLIARECNGDVMRDLILRAASQFGEVPEKQPSDERDLRERHRHQDILFRPAPPPIPDLDEQPTGFHRRLGVNIAEFSHQ